ncbi:MAG: hypothetical protein J6M12_02835 [Clostridia bacterium]|nr:hypothetical protein [Clostridia bacterium]
MEKQLSKKGTIPSPYKMLALTALLLPCLNVLIVGSLTLITEYLGLFYSYTVGGAVLTVISELLETLFNILKSCFFTCTLMTLGSYVFKKGILPALPAALAALVMGLFETLAASISLIFTFLLGLNDSTAALPNQLIPLIIGSVADLIPRAVLYFVAIALFFAVALMVKDRRTVSHERTPFLLTALGLVAAYTLLLLFNALSVVFDLSFVPFSFSLAPIENGNFINSYLLPFLYPIIYGGFMTLSALVFPRYLQRYYNKKPLFNFKSKKIGEQRGNQR